MLTTASATTVSDLMMKKHRNEPDFVESSPVGNQLCERLFADHRDGRNNVTADVIAEGGEEHLYGAGVIFADVIERKHRRRQFSDARVQQPT